MNRRTFTAVSLEIVFEMVLVGFLDDNCILTHADEYFLTDIHTGNRELVFVKIEVNIVIITALVFRPAWAEFFLSGHRGMLPGTYVNHIVNVSASARRTTLICPLEKALSGLSLRHPVIPADLYMTDCRSCIPSARPKAQNYNERYHPNYRGRSLLRAK